MADEPVSLHEVVKDIAARLRLDDAGRLEMSDSDLARNRAKLMSIKSDEEKKAVLISLVALVSRLTRESPEATTQAVERLTDLVAGLIGDPAKARAIFQPTGAAKSPKARPPKPSAPKSRKK